MSRYSNYFSAHAFQSRLKDMVLLASEISIDDLSQVDYVNEVTRLRKAVNYIAEIVNSIDPELTPLNVWDNFSQYASSVNTEIQNYRSNRQFNHIVNANSYVDNILNLVRPYLMVKGRAKTVGENVFAVFESTMEEYLSRFHNDAQVILSELQNNLVNSNAITNQIQSLKQSVENSNNKIIEIESNLVSLNQVVLERSNAIELLHSKMLIDSPKQPSIQTQIETAKDNSLNDADAIANSKLETESTVQELTNFYIKIFGKLNDDDERVGGLNSEIVHSLAKLRELEETNRLRYTAIIENIESLVPSATSAGLAKAYQDMKISFDTPIKTASYLFYGCIAILVIFSYLSAVAFDISHTKDGYEFTYGLVKYSSLEEALRLNFFKIPLWGSMVWLAIFSSKRRSEFQRLQQEYAHKEAFASSYISYKQQIEALAKTDTKLQEELIQKMINAIAFNASQTLDGNHGDKHPFQSVLETCSDKIDGKISIGDLKELFKK